MKLRFAFDIDSGARCNCHFALTLSLFNFDYIKLNYVKNSEALCRRYLDSDNP